MKLVRVTPENIEKEHICCAISNPKDNQVVSKKTWLSKQFQEGMVFLKGDVRGKCFIEYLPAESAWLPIKADNYMYIDCFWVSGQWKGKGYGSMLLDECIRDSKEKGKKGLIALTSRKKLPYLSDKKYLISKGFRLADTCNPYFELLYLPFSEETTIPKFQIQENEGAKKNEGFTLYYTHQCPFTAKYAPLIEEYAKEQSIPFQSLLINSKEEAKALPVPFSTFALFYNGDFITHEILSVKKFAALAEKLQNQ